MKPAEVIFKLDGEKMMLKHLNPNHLERVASFLTLSDLSHLSLTSKKMFEKMKDKHLEGVWVMNTHSTFMSRGGFTAIRNLNLIRIDKFLREIHQETETLKLRCKQD